MVAVIEHTHPPEVAFDTGCPACSTHMKKDRDRWRHEYRIEKEKNALLRGNYREAVADRDHFERALERILHGSEDHAWEDARKALDTRPSRRGGQS